jgi:hypothetical protein
LYQTQRNLFGKEKDFDYSFVFFQSHGYFEPYKAQQFKNNAIMQIVTGSKNHNLATMAHEHLHSFFPHYSVCSIPSRFFDEGFVDYY